MEDLEIICDETLIGCNLLKMGIITNAQVESILEMQKNGDARLFGEIAIELGFIDETALLKYLESKK